MVAQVGPIMARSTPQERHVIVNRFAKIDAWVDPGDIHEDRVIAVGADEVVE